MRIGIVLAKTPSYSETFFRSKIKGLINGGHKVILLVKEANPDFNLCDVLEAPKKYNNGFAQAMELLGTFAQLIPCARKAFRLYRLERETGKSFAESLKTVFFNAHILKEHVDWLHFGFATMALEKENIAKAIGAKMAVSFRGYDINVYPLKHPNCYNLLWQRVDKVHSISRYLLDQAYSLGLDTETPYQIIHPAVDLQSLPEPRKSSIKDTPIKIVTVARLHWIKGIDVAIKALQLLKEKGVSFQYQIIGEGVKKDYERYAYMAYALGLQDTIEFVGRLDHLETLRLLNETDIYLQPSLNEGFCNAVLEAQALGKLCVASRVGGLPENIKEEETGFLFEVGNASELAQVLYKTIEFSPEQRETIGQKARERVRQHFNLSEQQEQFLNFYNDRP